MRESKKQRGNDRRCWERCDDCSVERAQGLRTRLLVLFLGEILGEVGSDGKNQPAA